MITGIKIISGGQTGVDRAALDFALSHEFPCGGYCPKNRLAEDGTIPEYYPLIETESTEYAVRTEMNVQMADGVLIIYDEAMDKGTYLTLKCAELYNKPYFLFDISKAENPLSVKEWLEDEEIAILNIAGLREGFSGGIYDITLKILHRIFIGLP